MPQLGWSTFGLLVPASLLLLVGCHGGNDADEDIERRAAWIHGQTAANTFWGRDFFMRAGDSEHANLRFADGWYNGEFDKKTNNAWRWMGKHGIIRLRTRLGGAPVTDMNLTLAGWVPYEQLSVRGLRMEFSVNGHLLARFQPPAASFEQVIFVPKWLLERSDWVDFSITVANTLPPGSDWRELGFATSGVQWQPAPPK